MIDLEKVKILFFHVNNINNIYKFKMVQKIKDAANILKAKFKKDDLQESLIQATSEQNWQTPTNILHQIANASYNYEKCQQIVQFIWDKLKKKNSWRKILKTLNLVDFLLKNGPPNLVSSFKYEIYTFKTFYDFSHFSDNIDKGQGIREKARAIVDLLQNQQNLQQERNKAKTIRDRMSGITGGFTYGSYGAGGSDSKYQGFNNKSYAKNQFGNNTNKLNTQYGDYTYTKSTLDKYKEKETNSNAGIKKTVDQEKKDLGQQFKASTKKPFEQQPKKLQKPGQKPPPTVAATNQVSKPVTNDIGNNSQGNDQQQQIQNKGRNLLDEEDDVLGFSQPEVNTIPIKVDAPPTNANVLISQQPIVNPINETSTTVPGMHNFTFSLPMYNNNVQQTSNQMNFVNSMYGPPPPSPPPQSFSAQNYYMQQQQQQQWNYNGYQQPYMQTNQMYGGQVNPMFSGMMPTMTPPPQQIPVYSQISMNQPTKQNQNQFVSYQSGNNQNVKWLNEQEKGLTSIDFSSLGNNSVKKRDENQTNGANNGGEWSLLF